MKQCPACRTVYSDDTLSFCLEDGRPLADLADEEPTRVRAGGKGPSFADVPSTKVFTAAENETADRRSASAWIKIAAAIIIVGVVGFAAIGLAGAAFYYSTGKSEPEQTRATPTPRFSPSPTSDLEKERLRDEIANIQRKLDEQKNDKSTPAPDDDRNSAVTGTVNSPNDGFLALRSIPDAERGDRLAKIPHGAEVDILNCEKNSVAINGRRGRWCQIDYKGQIGWVFDAWLDY